MSGGFSPLPHAGHENPEADTHVESYEDVLSDAGSTPAASTTLVLLNQQLTGSSLYRWGRFGGAISATRHRQSLQIGAIYA